MYFDIYYVELSIVDNNFALLMTKLNYCLIKNKIKFEKEYKIKVI